MVNSERMSIELVHDGMCDTTLWDIVPVWQTPASPGWAGSSDYLMKLWPCPAGIVSVGGHSKPCTLYIHLDVVNIRFTGIDTNSLNEMSLKHGQAQQWLNIKWHPFNWKSAGLLQTMFIAKLLNWLLTVVAANSSDRVVPHLCYLHSGLSVYCRHVTSPCLRM